MIRKTNKTKRNVTRRDFLKAGGGAAALGGVAAAGLTFGPNRAGATELPDKWDMETDVVVIGFGGTGAAAAIEAHDAGAKVLIVEKAPMAGGNTAISGGIVYAAGTTVQKAAGISDAPEGMYKYWMAANHDLLDPELLRLLSEKSADAVHWLMQQGVEMSPKNLYYSGLEQQYKAVTEPVKRGHCATGKGKGLMKGLVSAVTDRKIEILYRTSAERLIVDASGSVIGVKAKAADKTIHVKANRGVVLGSGGFARNPEMVKSYFPLQVSAVPVVAPGLTGDGIRMASKIGSPIVDTGTVELPPSLAALEVVPGKKALMFSSAYFLYKYPAIFVNEKGKRFCDESAYYQITSPKILKEKSAYVIFDDRVRKEGGGGIGFGLSADLSTEIKNGWLKEAPTVGELAKAMELDPASVEEEVLRFNTHMKEGKDPDFGRSKAMGTIEAAPFYGGKLTVAVVETFGGVRVNTEAQVLDVYNEPVPKLYAGGAVAATMRAYAGSGAFLATCFVLGRIAGKNAAAEKA